MFKSLEKGDKVNVTFKKDNQTVIGKKVRATDNKIYIECKPPNREQRVYVFDEDTGLRPASSFIRIEPNEENRKKGIEKYKSLIIEEIDSYDDWREVVALYKKCTDQLSS
jgi:hypothetical protein